MVRSNFCPKKITLASTSGMNLGTFSFVFVALGDEES